MAITPATTVSSNPTNKAIYDRGRKLGELDEKIRQADSLDALELEALRLMRDDLIVTQHRATTDPENGRKIWSLDELAQNSRKLGTVLARKNAAVR